MKSFEIYLRRSSKIVVHPSLNPSVDKQIIATMLKNIENLGYTFSKELINKLLSVDFSTLKIIYTQTISTLKKMVGNKKYDPMYPNFPQQVMEASDAELYLNAIFHYLGDLVNIRIMPKYKKEQRFPLLDNVDLKVIELGSNGEYITMMKNLVGSATSISETDKEDIVCYLEDRGSLPDSIPHKEILSFVASWLFTNKPECFYMVSNNFKGLTDVLRFITALSSGDVSLATNTKFKKFKRKERRLLLNIMEDILVNNPSYDDMFKHKNKWLRIGEILHPGEHKKDFPFTCNAFKTIRNKIPYKTFNSQVEEKLSSKNLDSSIIDLLITKPGYFARRLDHVLRNINKSDIKFVLRAFKKVAGKVSTPVLLQVYKHFKVRNSLNERVVFPKGVTSKAKLIKGLPCINELVCKRVVRICSKTLCARFHQSKSLNKVYVDPKLKNYIVPFSQRSASKALRTITRGSNVPLLKGNTARFFLYWKQGDERVDIDLSAVMYNENWEFVEQISYTNLRATHGVKAAHSGDITSAPNGASEFIDIDTDSVVNSGGRYIIFSIFSYTGQEFNTIPTCFAGWMVRQKPNSGEIYNPKTVDQRFDLASKSTICVPAILDAKYKTFFWADLSIKRNALYSNNLHENSNSLVAMGKAITSMKKITLYELFRLHGFARGVLVDNRKQADTIFSVTEGVTPFDIETIVGEYLK